MRARSFIRQILLLAVLSALAQAQVVVTDDANTSSLYPTTNFGSSIALIVGSGSNTYIKFSLANLGAGVTGSNVSKATLILYTDYVLTSGTMDVYQINGSWSEGKITYNSAPVLGTKLFSAVSVTSMGYLSMDLTSTVQAWLNNTLANNGIALVPSSGSSIWASFDSKENILTSHTAQLALVLVSAGPQGPQGPQGLQGPAGPQGPGGPTGATGPQGAIGPAGAQGPQGLQGAMGLTGATGPQGPAGAAGANGTGFNFLNAFNPKPAYNVNDVVTYNGASYVAIAASSGPNNPTPDTNAAAWSVMAAQGAAGVAGAQGPAGPTGPQGPGGAQGPAGPQGQPGAQGPPGPTGSQGATGPMGPAGPQGPPGSGGGFSGIQEFTQSGTFTVPAGVTHLLVEMWGAGGGGGGGGAGYQLSPTFFAGAGGGGGGGGAYTLAVIAVTPGNIYSIVVGVGGAGGQAGCTLGPPSCPTVQSATAGADGADSQVLDSSSTVIVAAAGGHAGSAGGAYRFPVGAVGGAAGAGAAAASGANVVGRSGVGGNGGVGCFETCNLMNAGGSGGGTVASYLDAGAGGGGSGGSGDFNGGGGMVGGGGNSGYVLIKW